MKIGDNLSFGRMRTTLFTHFQRKTSSLEVPSIGYKKLSYMIFTNGSLYYKKMYIYPSPTPLNVQQKEVFDPQMAFDGFFSSVYVFNIFLLYMYSSVYVLQSKHLNLIHLRSIWR